MDQAPTTVPAGASDFDSQATRSAAPGAASVGGPRWGTQAARAPASADELGERACIETAVAMVKAARPFGAKTTMVQALRSLFGAPGDIPVVKIEAAEGSLAATMGSVELYMALEKLGRDKLMGHEFSAKAEVNRLMAKAGK